MKGIALVGGFEETLDGVYTSRCDEVWGLNYVESYNREKLHIPNLTRVFELHHPDFFTSPSYDITGEHRKWLFEEDHPYEIITLVDVPGIHNNKAFPIELIESQNIVKDGDPIAYATSSFCYMMAMALYEAKADFIEVWGFDMSAKEEYAYQKPAGEHWLGVSAGMGVKVWLHRKTKLLSSRLYGYDPDQFIARGTLTKHRKGFIVRMETAKAEANILAGRNKENPSPELMKEYQSKASEAFSCSAAIDYIDALLDTLDGKREAIEILEKPERQGGLKL